ncbi:MAG: hypothetical protein AAF623_00725, partial [Planctomycetota bacterium]
QNNPVSNLCGSYAQLKTPDFGGLSQNTEPAGTAQPNQPQLPYNSLRSMTAESDPASNGFPSTGRGGFAPRVASNSLAGTATLRATATGSTQGPIGSEKLKSVGEVEIPDAVLKGSGSYAPGSVYQLLR